MRVEYSLPLLSEATIQAILREQNQRLSVACELDLPNRLTDESFLASLWDSVSEMERTVIRLFVQASSRGFFSRKQWERISRHEHRHLSASLTKLRRLGVVLTVRKLWSEIGYVMPAEVRERFTQMLLSRPQERQAVRETLPYYIASGRGIHMDVFALFLFVRDNEVLLTQRRTVHRRFLQKMAPLVSLGVEHVQSLLVYRSSDTVREDDPSALNVVLDLAMRLQVVFSEEKRLRINLPQVQEWLRLSPSARWESMYRLVCDHYLPHEPWCEAFASMMNTQPPDQWSSVDQLLQELPRAGFECPSDAKERLRGEWLHLLLGFGWIELGEGSNEQLYWRWRGLARADWEEGWFVDPAGVVTIPPLVPLRAIWDLSRFGSLTFHGDSVICELQARPVQSFLARGASEEQALDTLQLHCVHPLPDSVKELVHRFGKTARQIRMEPMVRVSAAHPQLLEELRQIPSFADYMNEVITSTDFLIPLSKQRELSDLFRRHGYEPLNGMDTEAIGEEQSPHLPRGLGADGLFSIARPWDGYAVENTFPDPLEGMPQLGALPKIWTQHLQAYHPQTLRDLLKRAKELQVEVQVQLAGGDVWQAVPQKVEVEMGYWYVTMEAQRIKKRYRLDEIGRARIVVPDYLA
ncbi:hypothetical protein [Brevibacillus sp. H7]|uniref:hypothetical protein n=1 Tax=Brevibacillus sp. H7 TaxID=3349138 RepID=UPI0038011F16